MSVELEQRRSRRHQQPDGELDRRDLLDEVQLLQQIQQLDVPFERRPWREGDERRHQRHAGLAAQARRPPRNRCVCAPFSDASARRRLSTRRRCVTNRHPVSRSSGIISAMLQEMLDLDRDVVGEARELRGARARPDDARASVRSGSPDRRTRCAARRRRPARERRPSRRRAERRGTGLRRREQSGNAGRDACSRASRRCCR